MPKTIKGTPEQWQRLAEVALARRLELDLTAADACAKAGRGLSIGVLSLIENGKRPSYALRTIAALCRALDWTEGSVELILKGGDPIEITDEDEAPAGDPVALAARVAELEHWRDEWEPLLAHLKEWTSLRFLEADLRRSEIQDDLKRQAESDAEARSDAERAQSHRDRRGA